MRKANWKLKIIRTDGGLAYPKQREAVASLVYEFTGRKLKHSKTGRPFVGKFVDISVSHKDDVVAVAAVSAPYRTGIDVENIKSRINTKRFLRMVITEKELPVFNRFRENRRLANNSAAVVFWSVKESFFKCLDCDLKVRKINILNISKKGVVRFGFSDEIADLMKKNGLEMRLSRVDFKNNYVFSRVIMEHVRQSLSNR